MADDKPLRLGVSDAAKHLNASVETIRRMVKAERIRSEKDNTGKVWVFITPETRIAKPRLAKLGKSRADLPQIAGISATNHFDEPALLMQIKRLEEQLRASQELAASLLAAGESERAAAAAERARLLDLIEELTRKRRRSWWPWSTK
jgi:hypothetical protein